ncbi:hypothetical protein [Streptomyces antimicrobicus]|uniref:hypothetical protein n=1 Tax=Streptomyces antimicrobicus TaxID=2883108 RepID=UPI00403FDDE6
MDRARAGRARRVVVGAVGVVLVAGVLAGCGGRATTHHKPGTTHEQASGSVGSLLETTDAAGHRLREVAAEGAPRVGLAVRADTEDGWNLQLTVENFRFTPDSTGGAALAGAGHAHLELDGRKLARLYGPWFHLPAAQVPEGARRTLTVRLYADDHTVWSVGGKPVEATADLPAPAPPPTPAASGGHQHTAPAPGADPGAPSGGGTAGQSAGATAAPPAAGTGAPPHGASGAPPAGGTGAPATGGAGAPTADRTVTVAVRGGKVTPAPGRTELKRGERVALRVTSDRADTLHVHGYDQELTLPPGREAVLVLTVDRTGLFEVETHASGLLLTQLLVR